MQDNTNSAQRECLIGHTVKKIGEAHKKKGEYRVIFAFLVQ